VSLQIKNVLLFALLSASPALLGQPYFLDGEDPKPSGQSWQAVERLSDDFEDGDLDLEKWSIVPTDNGWSWIGRAPGIFLPENVSESDGKLKVTVSDLPSPLTINGNTYLYQGAIVRSWTTGGPGMYFEAKMKANATEMSSTFWLKPKPTCEKNLELDIQECVGLTSALTHSWAKDWDQIYHSNAWHHKSNCGPSVATSRPKKMVPPTPNHERYYVYGLWWKSETELLFFLDGEHVYTINPSVDFDMQSYIVMAIETYDWNPVPSDGGKIVSGSLEERTTSYEWVRVWQLSDTISVSAGSDQTVILPENSVQLSATVSDPSAVTSYQWTQISGPSSATLSGANSSSLLANYLVEGNYQFQLSVTDTNNELVVDTVNVAVRPNSIPSINSFKLPYGERNTAYSQSLDVTEGEQPLTWTLIGGNLPAGLNFSNGVISGTPTETASAQLTVRVEDNNGDQDQQDLRLRIVENLPGGNLSFTPTEDAYIEGSNPLNNNLIKIEDGRRVAYLKFNVSGIDGSVDRARLSMKVSTDGGNGTIRFYEGSHDSWTETSLTNANKPATGRQIGSISGQFNVGSTYHVELTEHIQSDGIYSIVVMMDNGGNDAWFSSKEGASAPLLTIESSQAIDTFSLWSDLQFAGLSGGSSHPSAAFNASYQSGELANALIYAYDVDPGESKLITPHLPKLSPTELSFVLPNEIPEDLSVRIEVATTLHSGNSWNTHYERSSNGSWPAPVSVSDNGNGTSTIRLSRGTDDQCFYRLRFTQAAE